MDSAVTLAIAKEQDYGCYALSIDYGQRHRIELEAARRVARAVGVTAHQVIQVDVGAFRGSALTDAIPVPKHRFGEGIPVTYVPARNTVFLSLALAWAEGVGAFDIFIGANAIDYSGYPDCRPEYLSAFESMAQLATKAGVERTGRYRIHAPLLELSKKEIVTRGLSLGVDFGLTSSCYDPGADGRPCGGCDACVLRRKGFQEAGASDPLEIRQEAGSHGASR